MYAFIVDCKKIAMSIVWEVIGKGNWIIQMNKLWVKLGLVDGRLIKINWETNLI